MGVFLGQLPPAELARLKAELAETLIAYFCYPRFFDYRTETLRTRPVDHAKRQEVWLYLSSVDFTAWNRLDLMSSDFQYQVERLFINFVQRNRSFFGEQGRKRMGDIRMLISTSATSVVQGLREHLSGNSKSNRAFGSPRRVVSWSVPSITGRPELTWEQIGQRTHVLQQQIQEARIEIKSAAARGPAPIQSQPLAQPPASNGTHGTLNNSEHQPAEVQMTVSKTPDQVNGHSAPHLNSARSASPVQNVRSAGSISVPPAPQVNNPVAPLEMPVASTAVPVLSGGLSVVPPPPSSPSNPSPPALANGAYESSSIRVSDADVAIFEQLRHQLIIWLRVHAVRSGIEIANQSPMQLLELLRQQGNCEETRLQIISTLLNLINQVIKNGHASLYDYKQALMLHVIHSWP